MLAYAGLRPQEALALRWADIRRRTIIVDAPKTGRSRAVRIVSPLAHDLAEWQLVSEAELLFPNRAGQPWSERGWANWRRRVWHGTPTKPGVAQGLGHPYLLRHTFVSLLIREGLSVAEVAQQAGHSVPVCLSTYAHVFADFEPTDRASAEELIRLARSEVFVEAGDQAAEG